jgi:hypothetical protein
MTAVTWASSTAKYFKWICNIVNALAINANIYVSIVCRSCRYLHKLVVDVCIARVEPDLSPSYVPLSVFIVLNFGAIKIATVDVCVAVRVTIAVDGVMDAIVNVLVSTLNSRVSHRCLSHHSRDFSTVSPAIDEPEVEKLLS